MTTSVETTSARGLDLTPQDVSKPDLKQVGLLFYCPRLAGLSGRTPAVRRAPLADARHTPAGIAHRRAADRGDPPERANAKLVLNRSITDTLISGTESKFLICPFSVQECSSKLSKQIFRCETG